MLYWICPECGHECSPAIRECPTCTAASESPARISEVQQATGIGQELLSLAENFQSPPSTGLLSAAPQRQLLTAAVGAAVAVQEPEKPVQPAEPKLSLKLAPLNIGSVKPARPVRLEAASVATEPVPARIANPAVAQAAVPQLASLSLRTAGLAPAAELTFQSAPGSLTLGLEQASEPLPSRRQSVAFVRAEVPMADHSGMAIAELAHLADQPGTAWLKPMVPYRNGQPRNTQPGDGDSMPLAFTATLPSLVASTVTLAGASLSELLTALRISAEEFDRAAIRAIQDSFSDVPTAGLLSAPLEIVTAPAPPSDQWKRSQKPVFTAVAPEYTTGVAVLAGPQAPPLAGPSLPPQLINFDHQNSRLHSNRKGLSGWPLTLLIGTLLILGAASLLQYMMQDNDAKTPPVAAQVQAVHAAPKPAAPAAPVLQEHPAARSVEVAGVRIVTGPNKKPQLQYVVINHSAAELTGLNIHIAVRSVDALDGPPLFSISSPIAALGANQSKEIRADVDPTVKPSALPDWQSLRTEVLVARQ